MYHSTGSTLSFKNLEPISYLKTFNRMVDQCERAAVKQSKNGHLRTVSLSKFPIPHYYNKMQGIFENVNKKRTQEEDAAKIKQNIEHEQFMKNHNEFMKNILERFIFDNETRQRQFDKQKDFYKINFSARHKRSKSESKSQVNIHKKKQRRLYQNPQQENSSDLGRATKGSSKTLDSQKQVKQQPQILPKLKPRKQKQPIKTKKPQEVERFLINRKLQLENYSSVPAHKIQRPKDVQIDQKEIHEKQVEMIAREKLKINQEIVGLQNLQASKQEKFGKRIQQQICKFSKKMDIQVHAINYFSFW